MNRPDSSKPSLRQRLSRPSTSYSLGSLLLIGFAVGVLFWGGFNTTLEWTNREGFCIACHEMYDNVYVEYKETIHYNNRTGVRATCADCHVPREWGPKMVRKVQATRELWGKITGTIDTREKFEEKRLILARREWQRMLANDSLECRNCHSLESMDVERQSTRSARQHQRAREEEITCIVCHQGIAHYLPSDMTDDDYLENLIPVIARSTSPAAPLADTVDDTRATPAKVPGTYSPASESAASDLDWNAVEAKEIVLFYPGIAHSEWISGATRIGRDRHGGGWAFNNGETCYACHFDETARMGGRIVTGAKLEPTPIPGKAAAIPVKVQAALTGDQLHLRFRWIQPEHSEGEKLDPDNPVKLAFMLDAGQVKGAERNGCWASCHADSRGMPEVGAEVEAGRSKYVVDGSLANGVFYDLVQWRSGDNHAFDGYVAEDRVMKGGQALVKASGEREGDTWTVTFVRNLAGGEGDITLEAGKVYNFGFAIHDSHSTGRFHHVSLGYTLGIDAGALISARRQ